MAKDVPSKKYKGVYYRTLKSGDRSYFLILRIAGRQKRIAVGKKSEGITEAFAYQQKVRIINADRFGEEQAEILQRTRRTDPTLAEVAEHYFKHGQARHSTKKQMRYLVAMVPFRDQRRVTERDITEWITDYREQVKPGTVNNKINLLRVLFRHAADNNLTRYGNPAERIKNRTVDDKRLRWLSHDEVDRLLAEVQDNENLYLFTKLALCTGARLSTLVRIHAADISKDTVALYNVKTQRRYTGFLDDETQRLVAGRGGYVLSFHDGSSPPKVNEYQWRMRRVFDALFNDGVRDPLDRVVIHTLRHTTASLLIQNGAPLHVVQKVLDHQSIRATERYAKLHQETIKNELHRLWN